LIILQGTLVFAVPIQNDPNGFEGIPWGATFSETDTFKKVEDAGRSQTYEMETGALSLGPAKVDSMQFVTSEGKFARVTVRYQGKATHDQILACGIATSLQSPRPVAFPCMEDYQQPLAGFEQRFTTDAACRAYLAKLRWPSGPPQGGISREQLDYSLDEFTFRFNRRTFRHRGKLFYRLVQQAGVVQPAPFSKLVAWPHHKA